jgi:hypothetical protein
MSNWTEKQLPGGAVVNVYSTEKTLEHFKRAESMATPKCTCLSNSEPKWHSSDCDVYKLWKSRQSK